MLSLIFKDFVSTAKGLGLMMLFYLGFSLFTEFPPNTYLIMGVFMFATQGCFLEEKNGTLNLLRIMPLKVSTVVWSKYIGTLCVAVLVFGIGAADLMIRGGLTSRLNDLLFGLFIMLVMMGFFMMTFFKFGYSRSSQTIIGVFLVLFIAVAVVPRVNPELVSAVKPLQWLVNFESWPLLQMVSVDLLLLSIYFATAVLATHFFKMRED